MRISSQMFQQNALRSLRANLEQLARAQEEAATGRRVRTVSDDPIDASQIMRMEAHLHDIDRYQRNGASARTRLATEDTVLDAVHELLGRARGLALAGAAQSPSDPLRMTAFTEVQELREQLVSLGNTKLGNEYIFGGGETTQPPFLSDGTYVGDGNVRQTEIDAGVRVDTNHTGDQVFSQALQALDALAQELQSGTPSSIQGTLTGLESADQRVLGAQTEVGSRQRHIDATGQQLAARAAGLLGRREALRDADPTESMLKVVTAQNALERAYAAVGRVLSTNFFDYLR